MILITKGGLSRGGDNEMPENCLYDCRLRDTCLYVPRWADEETLLRLGTERSKGCPLKEIFEVPKEAEQTEPQICETCRYYNSDIPCGSTPSACKEADKFAEEFVQGLKNLQMVAKTEPQTHDIHTETHECVKQTQQIVDEMLDEMLAIKKIIDDGKMPQTDCSWKKGE